MMDKGRIKSSIIFRGKNMPHIEGPGTKYRWGGALELSGPKIFISRVRRRSAKKKKNPPKKRSCEIKWKEQVWGDNPSVLNFISRFTWPEDFLPEG